jgi:hypothetical protein
MSWVTIIWSMTVSACLTLASLHLLVWWRRRESWAHALFALSAVGTSVVAICEFWLMRAETPYEAGRGRALGPRGLLGRDGLKELFTNRTAKCKMRL